jgi:DNA-binding response OmpR family regulator
MLRILIVEDESLIAWSMQGILNASGYEVIGMVATGEEAVQRATQEAVDGVIMDINLMGKMNGIQATRLIRQKKTIPILFVSGNKPDEIVTYLAETSVCDYLPKPVTMENLVARLHSLLPA